MTEMTYLEALNAALAEEMERDHRVFIMGEDVGVLGGAFRVTRGLLDRFGAERVIDTPISETGIVGAGIGAALFGMRPVVEIQFLDFIACAFDIIVNYAAKSRYRWNAGVPIVIRGPYGGGGRAGPFHSQCPEGFFMNVPGLKIVVPSTPADAKGLLTSSIRDPDPVLFFEHKRLYRSIKSDVPDEEHVVPLGKARYARSGNNLTIATYGAMVHVALEAAERAARRSIEAEVLDLRTLLPLDEATLLESVSRTGRLLVLHEATRTGGPGGEIAARVSEKIFERLDAPILRVAAPDTPVPFSAPLEDFFIPSVDRVTEAILALHAY
ncbi:MAG: alpha-ketoacid dehydrogenase subunit beta [Vicinamibacteria bacterium]|nr:alpha-ketoacid dehydrogenase subunit beta [Vicinamibacteria bacterium]